MLGNMGSGSEGGFAESESPVVLASKSSTMVSATGPMIGSNAGGCSIDGAESPDLESLRRLLETMLVEDCRSSSGFLSIVSNYLSSFESSSNNSQY